MFQTCSGFCFLLNGFKPRQQLSSFSGHFKTFFLRAKQIRGAGGDLLLSLPFSPARERRQR